MDFPARNASFTFEKWLKKTEIELDYRSSGAGVLLSQGFMTKRFGFWMCRRARRCRDLSSDSPNFPCLDQSLGMVNTGMIRMEHMEWHGPSLAASQNHGGSHVVPPSDF